MTNYLVEVRAYFTAIRSEPNAGDLAIEGWELDDRFQDPHNPNSFKFRAEQDVRFEANDAGEARRRVPEMVSPLVPSEGWLIDNVSMASDLVIDLDADHGMGTAPGGP